MKALRGTARDDRSPKATAGDRIEVAPAPPAHLTERAQTEWVSLAAVTVELGVLTRADLRALELLCETLATEAELRDLLKTEGLTIPGAGDNFKAHPGAKLLETTRNQAIRLLGDFGLTPRGRQSVDVVPRKKPNRFDGIGKRPEGFGS